VVYFVETDELFWGSAGSDERVADPVRALADTTQAGSVQVTVAVRVEVMIDVMSEVSTVVEVPEVRVCPAVKVVV